MIYYIANPYECTLIKIESNNPDLIRYPEDWPNLDYDDEHGKRTKYIPRSWVYNKKENAINKLKMLLEKRKQDILDYISDYQGLLHKVQSKLDDLNVLHTPIQS